MEGDVLWAGAAAEAAPTEPAVGPTSDAGGDALALSLPAVTGVPNTNAPWLASADADTDAANDGDGDFDSAGGGVTGAPSGAVTAPFNNVAAPGPTSGSCGDPDGDPDPKIRARAAWYCASRALRLLSVLSAASAALLALLLAEAEVVGRLRMRSAGWKAAACGTALIVDVEDVVATIAGIGCFVLLCVYYPEI